MGIGWLLALALAPADAWAAPAVQVPCPFEAGAQQTWHKQSAGAAGDVTHAVTVEVVSATDAVVTLEVDTDLVSIDARDPVMEHITRALDALPVTPQVVLDRSTSALSLANGEQLQAGYVEAGERAVASLREVGAPAAVLDLVPKLVADPALMEQSVVRDLTPLLSFSCTTLEPGRSTYTTELPSPFGASRLPASGVLEVTATPEALTVANVESIEAEALRASAMEAMSGLAQQLQGASDDDKAAALGLLQGARFAAGTELITVLDPSTGWATQVKSTRTVRGPGQERTDQVVFTAQ